MVSNSFLCHFPSHYLLRMNFRINCLPSVTWMLISPLYSLKFLTGWFSKTSVLGYDISDISILWKKNTCLKRPDERRCTLHANKKNAVCVFPGCEFCLSSDKACRGCVFREGCQMYLQRWASLLRFYQVLPQISIVQDILPWRYWWSS